MLRDVGWYLVASVSGKNIGPILESQAVQQEFLTLEDGSHVLSRNPGNELPTYASQHPRLLGLLEPWKWNRCCSETSVTN
jgi:hypothetical protein